MNFSQAKEEALALAPNPGEEYWISPEVLGATTLVRIDEVANGSISYTVLHTKEGWMHRPPAKAVIRMKSWWQAQSDGHIHADTAAGRRTRVRTV